MVLLRTLIILIYALHILATVMASNVANESSCWSLPDICQTIGLRKSETVDSLIAISSPCVVQLKAQATLCEGVYSNRRSLHSYPPPRVHTVIQVEEREPPARLRLNLYSFAATQPRGSSYVIWRFGGNSSQDRVYESFIQQIIEDVNNRYTDGSGKHTCTIVTKRFDPDSIGMTAAQASSFKHILHIEKLPWYKADLVRVVLLALHGGMYFDLDTVFLRDIRVLGATNSSFIGRWSMTNNVNNAVFGHTFADLEPMVNVLNGVLKNGDAKPMGYLTQAANTDLMKDFRVISAVVTDPLWPRLDLPGDKGFFYDNNPELRQLDHFYKVQCSYSDALIHDCLKMHHPFNCIKHHFFYGAVAYHWHSQWTVPINPISCGAVLCKILNISCI